MKNYLLLSYLLLIFTIGCTPINTPEDEPQYDGLSLNSGMSDRVVLDPKGSFTNIRFTSPYDWHIEISDDAEWLEITPLEGEAGTARIKIKAGLNDSGLDRTAQARICSGEESLVLSISQENFVPKFELKKTEEEVSFLGGELIVPLISDFEYDFECDADWVSYVETRASNDKDLVFSVSPNSGPSPRSTVITLSSASTTLEFTVSQGTDGLDSRDWTAGTFVHRSLAMRFTATWCGYCPYMATAFDSAKNQMAGSLELVSLHTMDSDIPFTGTNIMSQRFNVNYLPTGIIDARASIENSTSPSYTANVAIDVAKETQKEYPASVGIACGSLINDNLLSLTVGLYAKEAGSYRLVVLLLEDDIVAFQNGGGSNYVHNDVARRALTSMTGDPLTIKSNGQLWTGTYTARLEAGWNVENLKLLIYVERPFGSKEHVQNIAGASYFSKAETYVDNCRVIPLGEVGKLELR